MLPNVSVSSSGFRRPGAAIAALAVALLFQPVTANAVDPVSHTVATPPVWTLVTNYQANWLHPLDDQSAYYTTENATPAGAVGSVTTMEWQAYDWSADMTTYKTRPIMEWVRTDAAGATFSPAQFHTQAMARIGGTKAGPKAPLSIYFWDNGAPAGNGPASCSSLTGYTPIVRVTSGSPDIYWSCMPAPLHSGTFPGGIATGHATGGEADQFTGNLFVLSSAGNIVDNAPNGNSTVVSTAGGFNFAVWNPQTGTYSLSGVVQPGDWYQGMTTPSLERQKLYGGVATAPSATCDFALDANGNIYIYASQAAVSPTSMGGATLLRVEPARNTGGDIIDGTPDNPWRYYVVVKVAKDPNLADQSQTWGAANTVWGDVFLNGQYLLGANNAASTPAGAPPSASQAANGTTKMVKIDPLTGYAQIVYSIQNDPPIATATAYDNASPQQAQIIEGHLYKDVDGDGVVDSTAPGLVGQTVALYNSAYQLMGFQQTGSTGKYTFIVSGSPGQTYYVRPVQVRYPLADGVTMVNAAQTWGAGSVGTGFDAEGDEVTNTAAIQCGDATITSSTGGACGGAKAPDSPDPSLGAIGSSSSPGQWLSYATVTLNTSQQVPSADFGYSIVGSYGDAPAGPVATNPPVHINGTGATLSLGASLGYYSGPVTNNSHATDDGLLLDAAVGPIALNGTTLAATHTYTTMTATVGGTTDCGTSSCYLSAWTTGLGNNTWSSSPVWPTPGTATSVPGDSVAPFQYQAGGLVPLNSSVQMRVSLSGHPQTKADNSLGEYQATGASLDTAPWTTRGEIEDYVFAVADVVYRPAARTTSGTVDGVVVNSATLNGVNSTATTIGAAVGADAGTQTFTVTSPSNEFWIQSVNILDTETGDVLASFTGAALNPSGNSASVSVGLALGDDVTVEAVLSPNPDPTKSSFTVVPASQTVGQDVVAKATIVDVNGDPIEGAVVTFGNKSDPTTWFKASGSSCTTDASGNCSVTLTSLTPGQYPGEVTAQVPVSGVNQPFGGAKDVEFTIGAFDFGQSSFDVVPTADLADDSTWVVADGVSHYTVTLTAKDEFGNPLDGLDVAQMGFVPSSSAVSPSSITAVGNGTGQYSVTLTSVVAAPDYTVSVTYGGSAVHAAAGASVTSLPVPFVHGAPVEGPFDCADGRPGTHMSVADASVTVGGSTTATALVTDAQCNPVPGVAVTFSQNGDAVLAPAQPGSYTTDASGQAYASVTDKKAETVSVSGTFQYAGATKDVGSASVQFTAGEPAVDGFDCPAGAESTNLSASPASLQVGGSSNVRAFVTDEYCNPLDGVAVSFTSDLSSVIAPVTGTTVVGVAMASLTDGVPELVTVGATVPIGGVSTALPGAPSSPVQVQFTTGAFSWQLSTFTVTPAADLSDESSWVVADGVSIYTGVLSAKDVNGLPLPDLSVSEIEFTASSGDVKVSSPVVNHGDGTYSVTFTSVVADANVTAAAAYQQTQVGADLPIPFTHGEVWNGPFSCGPGQQGTHMWVGLTPVSVEASSTASMLVTDEFCNPIPGASVTFTSDSATALFDGQSSLTTTTGADGTVTVTVTDKKAETVNVSGSDSAPGTVPGSPQPIVFTAGAFSWDLSTFTVTPTADLADDSTWQRVGDGSYLGTLTAMDAYGNLLDGLDTSQMAFTPSIAGVSVLAVTPVGNGTGQYEVTFTSKIAGPGTVSAFYQSGQVDAEQPIPFTHGDVWNGPFGCGPGQQGTHMWVGLTPVSVEASSSASMLVTDEFCNPIPGASVTFTSDSATALFDGQSSLTTTTGADGTVTVTVTDKKAETVNVFGSDGAPGTVPGSPQPIVFTAGSPAVDGFDCPPGAEQTNLSASPASLQVGGTSNVRAFVTDKFCNPLDEVAVSFTSDLSSVITPASGTTVVGVAMASLTDGQPELVTVGATVPIGGVATSLPGMPSDPVKVQFRLGDFSWQLSTFTVTPSVSLSDESSWVVADGVSIYMGVLSAKDVNGLPLPDLLVSDIAFAASSGDVKVSSPVVNHGDGTYSVTFTSVVADANVTAAVAYQQTQVGADLSIPFTHGAPVVGPITCPDGTTGGSSVSIDKTRVPVDGTVTITALLHDQMCNVVPGYPVDFAVQSGSQAVLTNAKLPSVQVVTGDDGTASVTATDAVAETAHMAATIDGGTALQNSPVAATFYNTAAPTITSPTDGGTVVTGTPEFSGTGQVPGETVIVMDGDTQICTAVVDQDLNWSCTPTSPLTDGPHTITAVETNGTETSEPSEPLLLTVDTTPPAITGPTGTVVTDKPEITGTAPDGTTVTVTDGDGKPVPGCVDVPVSNGKWSCTPSSPLPQGVNTLTPMVTDPAGNTNTGDPVTVTVDTTPPAITGPTGTVVTDKPDITGTAPDGTTVTVTDGDGEPVPGCVDVPVSNGKWSCTPSSPLPQGVNTLTPVVTDPAGNTNTGDPVTVTVNTAKPPVAPVVVIVQTGGSVRSSLPGAMLTGAGLAVVVGSWLLIRRRVPAGCS